MALTRRSLLKAAALSAACRAIGPVEPLTAAPSASDDKQFHGLRVGVASYSLRDFPLAEALQNIRRLGVNYLSLKDIHLPLSSTPEQRRQVRQQAEDRYKQVTDDAEFWVILVRNYANDAAQHVQQECSKVRG